MTCSFGSTPALSHVVGRTSSLALSEEGGATAVEYALMVALIAAVIIGAVTSLGHNASTKFTTVGNAVGGAELLIDLVARAAFAGRSLPGAGERGAGEPVRRGCPTGAPARTHAGSGAARGLRNRRRRR